MLIAESEDTIARFKARCIERFGAQEAFGGPESLPLEQRIARHRNAYQLMLVKCGEGSSLRIGSELAVLLSNANRAIEAWQLMKKLISFCQQYHGREHRNTKASEQTLADIIQMRQDSPCYATKPWFIIYGHWIRR
jgi:hypothetical protein